MLSLTTTTCDFVRYLKKQRLSTDHKKSVDSFTVINMTGAIISTDHKKSVDSFTGLKEEIFNKLMYIENCYEEEINKNGIDNLIIKK